MLKWLAPQIRRCPLHSNVMRAYKTNSLRGNGFAKPKRSKQMSRRVVLPKFSSVANLASVLQVPFVEIQDKMRELGFADAHSDHIIDDESAKLIADEFGIIGEINANHGKDIFPKPLPADMSIVPTRPPVVALMGHVDHGKTTLLDYFRSSKIAAGEKGGITQHIGAFSTKLRTNSQEVCFLDTPGHEAFLKLRARGAHLTDIILLVVAADDSVMPQTREAIKHAKEANVPLLVALTKTDLPQSNPQKSIADLAGAGVDVEDYGGDTQCIPVSAVKKQGVDDLEAALMALIEVLDVRSPRDATVEGVVVESQPVKGLGNAATVIVRKGTLKPKQTLVAGTTWVKVRSLLDEDGKALKQVSPGFPAQVVGWKDLPEPGDLVLEAADEGDAKLVTENRTRLREEAAEAKQVEQMNENRKKERLWTKKHEALEERRKLGLNVADDTESDQKGPAVLEFVVKADVGGSAEALNDCIDELGNEEVKARVLFSGVGPVTENDIFRAQTAGASIIAFGTSVPRPIERLAEKQKVSIHRFDIIYKALEMISSALSASLVPEIKRTVVGVAEIREVFSIRIKKSTKHVAGIKVLKGNFTLKSKVRVMRDGSSVYEGKLASIQHGRDTVEKAHKNSEYGVSLDGWSDFQRGDILEAFEEEEIARFI